ncbi:ATP-binding protein [Polyangium aurulentum]|uniref:ATP-binding protein n=1 Tax=Polyangium aurulentum TaxID=2567896 RepID=UPI0010AE73F1|nr:ATP-binding protein [Polyangium aurulentum]UQA56780.1 ATP-binding protein [Polyangium aurulentum]
MQLHWFEVQGYKNLRALLRLDDLDRVNVLHGDNNVGKSNLLEALGLFFVLLRALAEDARGGPGRAERYARSAAADASGATVRSLGYFVDRGFPPGEMFNLRAPGMPIALGASLRLGPGEVEGGDPPWFREPMEVRLRLERRGGDEIAIRLERLVQSGGEDLAAEGVEKEVLHRALERLAPRSRGEMAASRFALIRADRTILTDMTDEDLSPLATREPMSRDLGLLLHDAELSTDPAQRARFQRFIECLGHFRSILGEGRWRMHFDRKQDRAELYFETDGPGGLTTIVPLRLMGSGIQQVANLCARLMMTGADIVAIEEPELNLRYSAQERLRGILDTITGGQGGPQNLFLTSHSPEFELAPTFYALLPAAEGPRVERRSRADARLFTRPEKEVPPEGARAPLSYVTTDGIVKVPDKVRRALGVENGGSVVFVQAKDEHYRILTEAQFWDLFEPEEPAP